MSHVQDDFGSAVAVIGMSGRFPGAADVEALWDNLLAGRPGIRPVTEAELDAAGVDRALRDDPKYVRVGGPLPDIAGFDASLFGFTPREADATDPQHRLFLECCWEALESAGYQPHDVPGLAGVFGGCGFSTYLVQNLLTRPDLTDDLHKLQLASGNDRDALPTMVSYKLGLRGPSVAVQTFCSTSLVAVHLAIQSLLTFECDVAVAGGASVDLPHPAGYLFADGGIVSPDGVVRSFDARANGTVVANGVGVVVLKRFDDAVRDGDHVHALVLGSAMNNDGRDRVGYSAPGMDGQAAVIEDAIRVSQVDPRRIGYVECHATGTMLGDSVELAAMRRAFAAVEADHEADHEAGQQAGAVTVLGSLKPTHGHLDRASGVSGLIRATLAVERGVLPGTPHYAEPNEALGEADGRFAVLADHRPWNGQSARLAGVSSFGLGGTNVHLVLGQAPTPPDRPTRDGPHLLVLSARDRDRLDIRTEDLRRHLDEHGDQDLADVAFTLQQSRAGLAERRFVVVDNMADAVKALGDQSRWHTGTTAVRNPLIGVHLPDPAETPDRVWEQLRRLLPDDVGAVQPGLVRLLVSAGLRLGALTAADQVADSLRQLADLVRAGAPAAAPGAHLEVGPGPVDSGSGWLLAQLGELWLSGVDWKFAVFSDGRRRRRALPTYPFRRTAHWIVPGPGGGAGRRQDSGPGAPAALAGRGRRADLADWFYQPVWRPRPLFAAVDDSRLRALGPWLVFTDDRVLDRVVTRLRDAGAEVLAARPGAEFGRSGTAFTLRPGHYGDVARLLDECPVTPRTVVHGWSLALRGRPVNPSAGFEAAQARGFHAVRATVRALTLRHIPHPVALLLVSDGAVDACGGAGRPEDATLTGLTPVITQEYTALSCRHLDIDAAAATRRGAVDQAAGDLLAELAVGQQTVVAHRRGGRWVRDYEPLAIPPASADQLLPHGGTVLITGGLGDVGLAVASQLARVREARLVLTAASELPDRSKWTGVLERGTIGERSLRHIRNVLALEEQGARVLATSVDVADAERMAELIHRAERELGRLDLVVHAAGASAAANFASVGDVTAAQAGAHFGPKVHGFLALQEILADRPALPRVTLSSLAAVLGGLAFGAYAGANAALDAYAVDARANDRGDWLTIDWETWRVREEQHHAPGTTIADYAMTTAEGMEVFQRSVALAPKLGHLVISSGGLADRLAEWVTALGNRSSAPPAAGPSDPAPSAPAPVHFNPRPPLSTPYREPATGLEIEVARIWSEVLGIDRVGADDDFFELGGHSLLATQLVSRLGRELAVQVPVTTLLQCPTVGSLFESVSGTDPSAVGDHRAGPDPAE
jgi:phthiocerol/phenolphthiocerol synthesis type-I polyketide synthase E